MKSLPSSPALRAWAATLLAVLLATLSARSQAAAVHTSIPEILEIPYNELTAQDPVRFECVVVGIVPRTGRLFVQENGHGLIVLPDSSGTMPPTGARILFEGTTFRNVTARARATRITILDPEAGIPEPQKPSVSEALKKDALDGALTELGGVIASVRTNIPPTASIMRNRVSMKLRQDGEMITVVAPKPNRIVAARIRHARIRARGPLMDVRRSPEHEPERILWAIDWKMIDIDEPGKLNPFVRRPFPSNAIQDNDPAPDDLPVRFRGRIRESLAEGRFAIGYVTDPGARFFMARKEHGRALAPGDVVDILGYPTAGPDGVGFEVTDFQMLGLPRDLERPEEGVVNLTNYVAYATTVAQIKGLNAEQTARGWPVEIDGFVSHLNAASNVFYLQRGSWGGVRVQWRGTNAPPKRFQRIRIDGHAVPGRRTPWLTADRFERSDEAGIADPREAQATEFNSGRLTGAWLKLAGVVRSVDLSEDATAILRLSSQGEIVEARVDLTEGRLPERLVDAEVELNGVAEAREDVPRAYPGDTLLVQSPEDLSVKKPSPAQPYSARVFRIAELAGQPWLAPNIHRIRVRGVVTFVEANRAQLDDGEGGVELRSHKPLDLVPGDRITALGFPAPGSVSPRLEDVAFRKLGSAPLPAAVPLSAPEVLSANVNGRRIRLRGTVVGRSAVERGRIELSGDGVGFAVELPDGLQFEDREIWALGGVVEVEGVCQYLSIEDGRNSRTPDTFRVLLARAGDAVLKERPSWWTEERSLAVVGGLGLLVFAAAGWAGFLRSRVRQNRAQFLGAFHANPMPAWIVRTRDWRCLEANPEFESLFG